ncbi:hypothetical protein NB724_002717 [Pantoea ananatis]|nr:hypothetical protein C1N63_09875 [Pantoea ananatis]MCW0317566.1 hypothetical protein [Pantoea ananatis]MCW0335735.1 hypothetical protein [Pantoea ananatis]MCW0383700.1 hypothetical protein [Pantoea ananatis]MCW0408343.1 hypothetical protein [Pantoea ananatis]
MVVLPLLYKPHAYTVAGGHGEHNVQRKKGLPGLTERGQHPAGRLSPDLFQTLPDACICHHHAERQDLSAVISFW